MLISITNQNPNTAIRRFFFLSFIKQTIKSEYCPNKGPVVYSPYVHPSAELAKLQILWLWSIHQHYYCNSSFLVRFTHTCHAWSSFFFFLLLLLLLLLLILLFLLLHHVFFYIWLQTSTSVYLLLLLSMTLFKTIVESSRHKTVNFLIIRKIRKVKNVLQEGSRRSESWLVFSLSKHIYATFLESTEHKEAI